MIDLNKKGVTLNNEGNFGEAAKVQEQAKQMAEENLDTKDQLRLIGEECCLIENIAGILN